MNLPSGLESETSHRFSPNSFRLHRLPQPRPGGVLGLIGANGIGKTTAVKILAGKTKPNLGRHQEPPDWKEIIRHFRFGKKEYYIQLFLFLLPFSVFFLLLVFFCSWLLLFLLFPSAIAAVADDYGDVINVILDAVLVLGLERILSTIYWPS